jgi:hypothetical protein
VVAKRLVELQLEDSEVSQHAPAVFERSSR